MPTAASASADGRERPQQPQRQPRQLDGLPRDLVQRLNLAQHDLRLDRPQRRAHRRDRRARIAGGADEERRPVLRRLLGGKVHVGARRIGQRGAADVADDADDLGRAVVPELDAAPDRILAREESLLDRFADDDDGERRRDDRWCRTAVPRAAGSAARRSSRRWRTATRRPADAVPRAPERSARSNGTVQLLPVSGITTPAPTASTPSRRRSPSKRARVERRARAAPRDNDPRAARCRASARARS